MLTGGKPVEPSSRHTWFDVTSTRRTVASALSLSNTSVAGLWLQPNAALSPQVSAQALGSSMSWAPLCSLATTPTTDTLLLAGTATSNFRTGPMDVLYGDPIPLRSAPATNLSIQVEELLHLVDSTDAPPVITSCVLHFGLVYLRPFSAGNGRLARLWQRRMLMRQWPVFGFLPIEAFIHRTEPAYYAALEYADRQGDCGGFITYLLERIDEALAELLAMPDPVRTASDRMALFFQQGMVRSFRRKDYLAVFPEISAVTASRDLREAVARGRLLRDGDGRTAIYRRKGQYNEMG